MIVNYILSTQTIATTNDWSSMLGTLGQFFFLIVMLIFILWLAVFATKLIAKSRLGAGKNVNIKIIESVAVGYQQMALQLVKVGNKYFVIGITKDRISFLTDVDSDSIELSDSDEKEEGKITFEKYLKDFINKRQG